MIIVAIGVASIITLDLLKKNKNWGALGMLLGLIVVILVLDPSTLLLRFAEGWHEAWVAPVFVMAAGFATDYYQQSGAMSVLSKKVTSIWWLGIIVFALSIIFDNTIATLIGLSLVTVLRGHGAFAVVIAFWALLGGLFSPIGDITTLMLWLAGKVTTTGIIFKLALPSIVGFVTVTFLFRKDFTFRVLKNTKGTGGIKELLIAVVLFFSIPILEVNYHISPGFTVLGVLFLSFWILRALGHKIQPIVHDPAELAALKKTSIYIFLVLMSVGLISRDMELIKDSVSQMPLSGLFGLSVGVSSHVDNIPWTAFLIVLLKFAVDSYEWLIVAIGVGLGGGFSPIGSTSTLLSTSLLNEHLSEKKKVGFKDFYMYAWKLAITVGVVVGALYIEKIIGFVQ